MPYIDQVRRDVLAYHNNDTGRSNFPLTAGELNYCITTLLVDYLAHHADNYQTRNDILGAIEGAKLEFVRRAVNDYEDTKIKSNGDVYK